jgi:hypothetical protein
MPTLHTHFNMGLLHHDTIVGPSYFSISLSLSAQHVDLAGLTGEGRAAVSCQRCSPRTSSLPTRPTFWQIVLTITATLSLLPCRSEALPTAQAPTRSLLKGAVAHPHLKFLLITPPLDTLYQSTAFLTLLVTPLHEASLGCDHVASTSHQPHSAQSY